MKQKFNGAKAPGDFSMSSKRAYAGNCRMIEIGAPGTPFRLAFNVDRIDNIRFEETFGTKEIPAPNAIDVPAIFDDDGNQMLLPKAAATQTVKISTGWTIAIVCSGMTNTVDFSSMEFAMSCYNNILKMIQTVGVPTVFGPPLRQFASVAGTDAADLHPDLAGGDGAGVLDNDDYDEIWDENTKSLELTEEEIALLENPEVDPTR